MVASGPVMRQKEPKGRFWMLAIRKIYNTSGFERRVDSIK